MTLSRSSAADSTNNSDRSFSDVARIDLKRKRDALTSPDYVGAVDLLQGMKRRELEADYMAASAQQTLISWRSGENSGFDRFLSSSGECSSSNRPESTRLQIFVRMMSGGKTLVIHADKNDTVEKLHQRIEWKTKIPVTEQRVIYKGKQLQYEHSLAYYSIEQDASLQLVGRMQSTEHPVAWQTIDDIMYTVSRMYKGENLQSNINEKLVAFFAMIPAENGESIAKYLTIFSSSSVPAALVMLYASSLERNKSCAKGSIKLFLNSCTALPKNQQNYCLPLVLEFCKLLRKVCPDQKLYATCRNTLGSMLETFDNPEVFHDGLTTVGIEIFPFFTELTGLLVNELVQNSGPSFGDFHKLSSFWQQLRKAIECNSAYPIPIVLPLQNNKLEVEIGHLHRLFGTLLTTMGICMSNVESSLADKEAGNSEIMSSSWSQYLAILKIINSMSNLYHGGKEQLTGTLIKNKVSFCTLIVKFAKRGDDHQWIFEYKEATNFEARRHLAMLLFPDVKEDFDEMHEMLIDRSNLLAESFEYIVGASPEALHGGLFMEFKNEEATGPGVLREWFYLVCQEIFNQQNTLFLRSADDFRRFSPNPGKLCARFCCFSHDNH